MSRFQRLLFITFIESFATILLERGVYFYSDERLGFSPAQNLWLALGIGTFYVLGALSSHRLSRRASEKRVLVMLIVGSFLCHTALSFSQQLPVFLTFNLLLAFLTGAKWPLIESYVSAGLDARGTARAVGLFSIGWSLAVPPAMAASGQLIAFNPGALFAAAALINVLTLLMLRPLELRPVHIDDDHPMRPPADQLARYRVLVVSSRWSMLASYALLFLLAPLLPDIFKTMGLNVRAATLLASVVELVRAACFILMFVGHRWHGHAGTLAWSAVGLPVGFFLILFAVDIPQFFAYQPLAAVLVGQVVFGVAAGVAYYAALYYAMVVSNASVESGGAHESLVGGGFAIGPAIGLIGLGLAVPLGSSVGGMLLGVTPMIALCVGAALLPMRKLPKQTSPVVDLERL